VIFLKTGRKYDVFNVFKQKLIEYMIQEILYFKKIEKVKSQIYVLGLYHFNYVETNRNFT